MNTKKLIDGQGDELHIDQGTKDRPVMITAYDRHDTKQCATVLLTKTQAIEMMLHLADLINESEASK